jgi:hypothetical protein
MKNKFGLGSIILLVVAASTALGKNTEKDFTYSFKTDQKDISFEFKNNIGQEYIIKKLVVGGSDELKQCDFSISAPIKVAANSSKSIKIMSVKDIEKCVDSELMALNKYRFLGIFSHDMKTANNALTAIYNSGIYISYDVETKIGDRTTSHTTHEVFFVVYGK